MTDWLTIPYDSNKLKQTYFQNFIDVSGVMSIRNSNNINLYTNGATPDFSINSQQIRVKDQDNYYDISNSKLRHIQTLYENVQDRLEDLVSRTQYTITSPVDEKTIFYSSIEISNNLICLSDLSLGGNLFIDKESIFNGRVDICGNLYATYPNSSIPISAITNLESNLNTKSNLISPEFTGTPISPTAVSGTNTNQIATTAFVADALIGKADIAIVDVSLNLKADLASPSFTGTPLAPTAASGTNSTQLATTAFVSDAVSGVAIDLTQDISVNSITIGRGSGNINTNTVVGSSALDANQTGYENVAIGNGVLNANTNGYRNLAIGVSSLYTNTSGYENIAMGTASLYQNTLGYRNIGIGVSSLYTNTSGFQNVAVGRWNLFKNATGSENCSVGFQSLYNNTTGSNNSVLGNKAGLNNTDGSGNTFIGANTNITPTNATWTNSTALGYGAIITGSNQVILGNNTINSLRCQVQTITSVSDIRDKKNIQPLTNGITFVEKLTPVKFDWNMRDKGKVDIPEMGFIAQDLQQVQEETGITVPGLVYDNNPDRLEASYGTLIPILVKAIQDLSEKVTTLEIELNKLKSSI
jgi:hypothetical protein